MSNVRIKSVFTNRMRQSWIALIAMNLVFGGVVILIAESSVADSA